MKAMRISTGSASKVLQDFIKSGGKGSDGWLTRGEVTRREITAHGQTLDKVLVPETRCCRQKGGQVPEDLRVLYPIEAFGDFGEDGRLKSFQVCNTDTPLQKKVKKAKLTRMEIIAITLYTGDSSEYVPYDGGLVTAKALSYDTLYMQCFTMLYFACHMHVIKQLPRATQFLALCAQRGELLPSMLMYHIMLMHLVCSVTDHGILRAHTRTHVPCKRSLLHDLQWHVARIRGLW